MATVKTGYNKWQSYLAFAQESTFGTAITDGSNFTKLDIVGGATPFFSPDFFEDTAMRNRGLNVVDEADYYSTSNGLWQRLAIPDFIAPADVLGEMLYGVTQQVSEAVGSPYVKTYTLNGATNPDFSSNAGYFFSLLLTNPASSTSQKLTSCVLENLSITLSPDNGGRAICSATALTGKGFTGAANPSGTNTFSTVAVPNFHNSTAATLSIGGIDLAWYSFVLNINSRYAWLGYASGKAENYKYLGSTLSATTVVKLDTNSDSFLGLKASKDTNLILTIGDNSTAGYFKLTGYDVIYRDVVLDSSSDEDVQKITLTMDITLDSSATEYPTIETADGVDQAW